MRWSFDGNISKTKLVYHFLTCSLFCNLACNLSKISDIVALLQIPSRG